MSKILSVETKEDSFERLAAIQGIDSKYVLLATELNTIAEAAIQSAVDNLKINFSWSNRPGHYNKITQEEGLEIKKQLLVVDIKDEVLFKDADEVWLLIDRYRPKRRLKTKSPEKFRKSGFKHDIFPNPDHIERPSEVRLEKTESIVDFNQEFYFKYIKEKGEFSASGMSSKQKNKKGVWQHLSFRIKIVKNKKAYVSNSVGQLKMFLDTSSGNLGTISYRK